MTQLLQPSQCHSDIILAAVKSELLVFYVAVAPMIAHERTRGQEIASMLLRRRLAEATA